MRVVDKNGVLIRKGQRVLIHQDDGITEGVVVEAFPRCPTVNQPGSWVDIDRGDGPEGMMSYVLEVKP